MRLSVVILSYNHPEITARAVISAQQFDVHEIILVHNGSSREHVDSLTSRFTSIAHLIIDDNIGYGGGVNRGLKRAFQGSSWVILLTNDAELINLPEPPNFPAMAAPKILLRHTLRVDSLGGIFLPHKARIEHCRTEVEFDDIKPPCRRYIPGTCFLIHRECFELVGDFDEELTIFWDDVDWCARANICGVPLIRIASWHVRHGGGKTAHRSRYNTFFLFQRNRIRISKRYNKQLPAITYAQIFREWLRILWRAKSNDRRQLLRYIKAIFESEIYK